VHQQAQLQLRPPSLLLSSLSTSSNLRRFSSSSLSLDGTASSMAVTSASTSRISGSLSSLPSSSMVSDALPMLRSESCPCITDPVP